MVTTDLPTVLGRNLRRLREAKGMTHSAVAEAAGLGRSTVIGIELGYPEQRDPRLSTLKSLARVLGVSVAQLTNEPIRRAKAAGGP